MKYTILLLTLLCILACKTGPPKSYLLDEVDLVPEGIAYSKTDDTFYLTSVAKSKIIAVDRVTGAQSDFIAERAFGYSPGVGILVDEQRNLLHAIGGFYLLPDSVSTLFTFDLSTKKLLKRYDVDGKHFLNDLIQDKAGNLYLTDTKDASVYLLKKKGDSLELFYHSDEIEFPNGIAISEDNTKLYIASMPKGIRILDIKTKELLNDVDTTGMSQGIDGLEFYNNHLYAIQNGVGANTFNFRKLVLNEQQDAIIGVEVIDGHNPELDVPLTFCIMDDKAVVIGNSNLQHLDQKTFEFSESESVLKTKLLVYDLNL